MASYDPNRLPLAVRTYIEGRRARDLDLTLSVVTDATVITDDGHQHVGRAAVRAWLVGAATEWEYTEQYLSQEQLGTDEWVLVNHLEGNFPGGVVDLRYHFVLAGDALASLTIAV